ncbi:hypothetical protein [Streptomyces sp. NPDC046985]|uniref:hypothetical protein n=1 Tax=Streptomyces sp. NPDC046985 TaxID=3155377 RepID=UPI0033C1865D
MSVPAHPRSCPATPGGLDFRLPWWALTLPALAFAALLALILNPSGAHTAAGDPALTQVLQHVRDLVARA